MASHERVWQVWEKNITTPTSTGKNGKIYFLCNLASLVQVYKGRLDHFMCFYCAKNSLALPNLSNLPNWRFARAPKVNQLAKLVLVVMQIW
jgi:hypothetical protein